MGKRLPAWAVIVLAVAAFAIGGGLLWLLVKYPNLAAPVEAVAVVLGTGFTAFAAFSAWRAAQAVGHTCDISRHFVGHCVHFSLPGEPP